LVVVWVFSKMYVLHKKGKYVCFRYICHFWHLHWRRRTFKTNL